MTKAAFLEALRKKIESLPPEDRKQSLDFYAEMIDDRLEDGMTEEQAVADLGNTDEIAAQILSGCPADNFGSEEKQQNDREKRSLRTWEIVLLILGSPIWVSLLLATAIVVFAVFITLWAVLISFYAVAVALVVAGIACVAAGIVLMLHGWGTGELLVLGAGLFCAGFGLIWFVLCHYCSLGVVALCRLIYRGIRSIFVRKGGRV